jgi:hypothetical protein
MNKINQTTKRVSSCLAVLLLVCQARSSVADSFEAHNKYPQNVFLWMYPKEPGMWENKKPFIKRDSFEVVDIKRAGSHYLMLKDEKGRERHLGWFPFPDTFKGTEPKKLVFGVNVEQTVQNYTVQIPQTVNEEVTYTVNVERLEKRTVIRNGVTVTETVRVSVPETRTRTVAKTVYTTETRTRTVDVERPFVGTIENGEIKPIQGRFQENRKIGVTFRMAENGVQIISVESGSASQNMWDENGNVFKLEPRDSLLRINGVTPRTKEQFLELINNARGPLNLVVLDKDGFTQRDLIIEPR